MKKRWYDTALSLLFAVALFFFILTFSIGLPIYFRPFYYAHIEAMNLPEKSGFSTEEIKEAYDNVLDYLTLPNKEFSTGIMAHSDEGEEHFKDCKVLFDLNAEILITSGMCLLVLLMLRKTKKVKPFKLGMRSACFYSALMAIFLPIILGGLASLDFDKAFIVFHNIFFNGKENWLFNPRTDEIIRILPQDFFMHCAFLIGAGVLIFSSAIIIRELIIHRKKQKTA